MKIFYRDDDDSGMDREMARVRYRQGKHLVDLKSFENLADGETVCGFGLEFPVERYFHAKIKFGNLTELTQDTFEGNFSLTLEEKQVPLNHHRYEVNRNELPDPRVVGQFSKITVQSSDSEEHRLYEISQRKWGLNGFKCKMAFRTREICIGKRSVIEKKFQLSLQLKIISTDSFSLSERKLLVSLMDLYLNQVDCDVQFIFSDSDRIIGAHKIILKNRSPVFARMFEYDIPGTRRNPVCIEDVETDAFDKSMKYIYSGRIENPLSIDSALELLQPAQKYDIDGLVTECTDYLNSQSNQSSNTVWNP